MNLVAVRVIINIYIGRSSSARLVFGNCVATHGTLFTCFLCLYSLSVFVRSHVC